MRPQTGETKGDIGSSDTLGDGAARLLPIVTETMREVKEKVGLA